MKEKLIIQPTAIVLKKVHSLKKMKGKIAAIEPVSGKWVLGNTIVDVLIKAKEKYPGKIFFLVRIGYNASRMSKHTNCLR